MNDPIKDKLMKEAKKEIISELTKEKKDLTEKEELEKGMGYAKIILSIGWMALIFGTTDEIDDFAIYFGWGGALFFYLVLGFVGKKIIKQKFPD